jgi:hypothetical protein
MNQETRTANSLKHLQIFDRLAHSSIMRLNKNSMDKLYGEEDPLCHVLNPLTLHPFYLQIL